VFLGYSTDHKGYWCLDLHTNRIIISRYVIFDETVFPFADMSTSPRTTPHLIFWTPLMIPLYQVVRELCLQVLDLSAVWTLPR
jgi:hypothetical protein